MKLSSKTRLLMIGDSITDAGRARPIGEAKNQGLGAGYVSLVDALLNNLYPDAGIRTFNLGISGNTVRDLKDRWQTDVLNLKPDWLSIMIGTNDVWRQFDSPNQPERHVYPNEYESTLRTLVATTRPIVKGLVLMTPFYVEPDPTEAMRSMMDRYGKLVKAIAGETDSIFVDTQAAFNALLQHQSASALAPDLVHPTVSGHMVLALAFLRGIGVGI